MKERYIFEYDTSSGKITDWWITFDQELTLNDNNISVYKSDIDDKNVNSISELEVDTKNKTLVESQRSYYGSLGSLKDERISELKSKCFNILSETDWYITRKQETGKPIPQEVLDHRSNVRSKSNVFESEIRSLNTIDSVLEYNPSFPVPPN